MLTRMSYPMAGKTHGPSIGLYPPPNGFSTPSLSRILFFEKNDFSS